MRVMSNHRAMEKADPMMVRIEGGRQIQNEVDGAQIYKSSSMTVTKRSIMGKMMKAIENRKTWHKDQYHEKFFTLVF